MLSKRKQIRDRIKNIGKKKFGTKNSNISNTVNTQKQAQQGVPSQSKKWYAGADLSLPKGKQLEECTLEDLEYCIKADDVAAEKALQQPKVNPRVVVNGKEGCVCEKCKDFYPFAEPNMSNGSMICYSCRNPW